MHDDVLRAFVAWGIGSLLAGLALTVLGFALWWTYARERFGWLQIFLRAGLGIFGCAVLWVGLTVIGIGTESFLGNPLGRWTGAPMVPLLWISLELLARDQALVAGLLDRDLDSRLGWFWARLVWIAAKVLWVLSGYVVLWASFGV